MNSRTNSRRDLEMEAALAALTAAGIAFTVVDEAWTEAATSPGGVCVPPAAA